MAAAGPLLLGPDALEEALRPRRPLAEEAGSGREGPNGQESAWFEMYVWRAFSNHGRPVGNLREGPGRGGARRPSRV